MINMNETYDLIVIGAGPGGADGAIHAAQMGKKVLLVEKNSVGGTCLNVGCIPTKVLLKSAHVFTECSHADGFGVGAENVSFDMKAVQQRKQQIIARLAKGLQGSIKRAGVERVEGRAEITAPGRVRVGETEYAAANILIASGSAVAVPPVEGIDSSCVMDSGSALDLDHVPESMVIIGAGVIGLEFSSFFSAVGTQVTVIEVLADAGAGIDRDIAKRLTAFLKKQKVRFHFSSTVTKISGNTVFFTDSKGNEQSVDAECVLLATGRKPVVEGLGLDNTGVVFSPKGIEVSDTGETAEKGIWACGDVTGKFMLAHVATMEAVFAVNNMFGQAESMSYDAIPNVVYSHPEAVSVGQTEQELADAGRAFVKSTVPMGISGKFAIAHNDHNGFVKVLREEQSGVIIGIHIFGDTCSEMAFAASLMIGKKMTSEDMRGVIFPHPTVSEALKASFE